MTSHRRINGLLALALASAVITGCGESSGGGGNGAGGDDSGGSDNGSGADWTLPQLPGLEGDADNQDILYFSNSYQDDDGNHSALYAMNPANPDSIFRQHLTVEGTGDNPESIGRTLYRPLVEADIDENDGRVDNYRVSDVLFAHNRESGIASSEGFARASTDGDLFLNGQMGVRVSSETFTEAQNMSSIGATLRQTYINADRTELSYGGAGNKMLVRMDYPAADDPLMPDSKLIEYITPVDHVASDSGSYRYLTLKTDDATLCNGYFLSRATSNSNGSTSLGVDNLLPNTREASFAAPLGGPLTDKTQYLVINVLNQADCTAQEASVWRYDPSAPVSSGLTQVLNGADEPLIFPTGVAGAPFMPADRHMARKGNVLFFGIANASGLGQQDLYRIEGDNWSLFAEQEDSLGFYTGFIIAGDGRVAASVGSQVVSWDTTGNDRQVLDDSTTTFAGIMTDVLGSRSGWIYYNRADHTGQDHAVAMKMDGSDSLEIPDAQWFGASSTGKGDSISNMTELSEVFLWRDGYIGAVIATNPGLGLVILGDLDSTPDNVLMRGMAPGPHRLIEVLPAGEDEGRVYYVNTRVPNSLQALEVEEPTGHQRPVDGF
ncbi:MAG: hypothetical protein ABJ000_18495 [Saccharospirillum sp.]|uniref:hypothetical protein n=1 Tax=Saccharospirillum sp. TaxID=2033801 RepID=UPI0032989C2A